MPTELHAPWFGGLVAVLATWRLAHLLAREDGPFDVVVRLRHRAGEGARGRLMDCPYCLSLWIAAPLSCWLAWNVASIVPLWLAISGGACMIERLLPRSDA